MFNQIIGKSLVAQTKIQGPWVTRPLLISVPVLQLRNTTVVERIVVQNVHLYCTTVLASCSRALKYIYFFIKVLFLSAILHSSTKLQRHELYSRKQPQERFVQLTEFKSTVNPAKAVTSIKQSPVLKGHLFHVLSQKSLYELNLF